jgi:transposase InsO family protein
MRRIDELHLEHPFAGSRMLRDLLRREGITIGRLAVATLMRRMGIEALYRRPNTSKPAPGHKIYPYLLRNLVVDRPNQVWAMDITYIPMARGFVYLAAVVDWFSRRVLAWRLSITLETEFCLDAVNEALARHGKPEIFNTDQGSQFTERAMRRLWQAQRERHMGRARAAVAERSRPSHPAPRPGTDAAPGDLNHGAVSPRSSPSAAIPNLAIRTTEPTPAPEVRPARAQPIGEGLTGEIQPSLVS